MSGKRNPYGMTTPCDNCPFRNDIEPYLTPARVREIEDNLIQSEFHCHKTTDFDDEGELRHTGNEIHCAGALILLEKLERPSQMMRICERIGMYDARKLDMEAPVFDSFDEMFDAAKKGHARKALRAKTKRKM